MISIKGKQFYHCFGCGAHGNAIDFLMQYERLEFPEAIETLAKQIGLEVPRENTSYQPGFIARKWKDFSFGRNDKAIKKRDKHCSAGR